MEAGEADLVILAGDVHTRGRGVAWAQSTFTSPVAYVTGNHEFYRGHIDRTLQKMKNLASGSNVHVLENETLEIGNVRVLGATAWSDFTAGGRPFQAAEEARRSMNDFRLIRSGLGFRALSTSDVISRNRGTYEWLAQELSKTFDGKTIVVTHHCPIISLSGPEQGSLLMPAFTNEWPELVPQADLWVFGHTHSHIDVIFDGCRVLSNPRGYPGEDCGFDPDFIIEI
jgi:predicted phosphodiesterase